MRDIEEDLCSKIYQNLFFQSERIEAYLVGNLRPLGSLGDVGEEKKAGSQYQEQ